MSDLFNNPMVTNAYNAMSEEEIENFRKIGEEMYGNINFEQNKILNNIPPPMAEAVAYVEEGLKSGLMPIDLDENEIFILVEAYGDKWYEKYGFTEDEVPEPGLSLQNKQDINDSIKSKLEEAKKQKVKREAKKKKRDVKKANNIKGKNNKK